MYYITKAQHQQLIQNKIRFGDGEYVPWGVCVIPYGIERGFDLGLRLMQLDTTRPNFAVTMHRYTVGEGTEHENDAVNHEWVQIKVIRSKFLHDLKLAYAYWRQCHLYLPYTR